MNKGAARVSIQPSTWAANDALQTYQAAPKPPTAEAADKKELRETFDAFVGQVFYGEMLKAMRRTVDEPAYFHGGRAEEMFQQQLDQMLGEKLSDASADKFSGPMFELFSLERR